MEKWQRFSGPSVSMRDPFLDPTPFHGFWILQIIKGPDPPSSPPCRHPVLPPWHAQSPPSLFFNTYMDSSALVGLHGFTVTQETSLGASRPAAGVSWGCFMISTGVPLVTLAVEDGIELGRKSFIIVYHRAILNNFIVDKQQISNFAEFAESITWKTLVSVLSVFVFQPIAMASVTEKLNFFYSGSLASLFRFRVFQQCWVLRISVTNASASPKCTHCPWNCSHLFKQYFLFREWDRWPGSTRQYQLYHTSTWSCRDTSRKHPAQSTHRSA